MSAYTFDVIFTVEARSNVFLEVMAEHFRLSESRVFAEIQNSLRELRAILDAKGVAYADLKHALVPSIHNTERAFVFDWTKFEVAGYGREVMHRLLPLLNRNSTQSVLCGDWTARDHFADVLAVSTAAGRSHPILRCNNAVGDTLYFVYLNNLTRKMASDVDQAFTGYPPYVGSVDLTFASLLKAFLSTMLVRAFVKHQSIVIQGHEGNRDPREDVNLVGYDFAASGYQVRSVPIWLYGLFLSYKIERPVDPEGDTDTRFSLNALSPNPLPMSDLVVILEERKLAYLQREKAGSMKRAALEDLSAQQIARQIRGKLSASYFYNLSRAIDGETLKFDVVIENARESRTVCALEYRPQDMAARVITFY
jgi:hypothetical protein